MSTTPVGNVRQLASLWRKRQSLGGMEQSSSRTSTSSFSNDTQDVSYFRNSAPLYSLSSFLSSFYNTLACALPRAISPGDLFRTGVVPKMTPCQNCPPFAIFIAATCLRVETSALHSVVNLAYISLILIAERIFVCNFRFGYLFQVYVADQACMAPWENPLFSARPHPGEPRAAPGKMPPWAAAHVAST